MGQVMGIAFQFCKMKRCKDMFHNNMIRNSMVVQKLGLHAFLSGAWVWFSTRKLSFKLHSTAKTMTTTTKQHCDCMCVCVCVCVCVLFSALCPGDCATGLSVYVSVCHSQPCALATVEEVFFFFFLSCVI